MSIIRNVDGAWEWKSKAIKLNPIYREAVINYLNILDVLFRRAKETCEFEFILTLLRFRGIEDPGWDTYENTQRVFRCISKLSKRYSDCETKRHIYLWLYGHIIEASEPYEILANLINVIAGKRYSAENFPHKVRGKYTIPQSPAEKIDALNQMVGAARIEGFKLPIEEFYDRDLRNAIFHSDYSLINGEVRIRKPLKSYSNEEINEIINKGLAYYEAFQGILSTYTAMYNEPIIISVHPEFSPDPNEKAITIVRKAHGLAGIKDNWTREEISAGYIPYRIGRFLKYEQGILAKDPFTTILPKNRAIVANKFLRIFPRFLRKIIVDKIKDKFT
jgi:hypothetical protein